MRYAREAVDYALTNPLKVDRGSSTGRVALEGKAVHIHDVPADPEYSRRAMSGQSASEQRSACHCLRQGTAIGVFALTRDEVNPFTEKQIELVDHLRRPGGDRDRERAVVRSGAKAYASNSSESLEQQTATSKVLSGHQQLSWRSRSQCLKLMLENAVRICDAKFGNIYRWDGEALRLVATHNTPPALVEARRHTPLRPATK